VPAPEFLFAITLSGRAPDSQMLSDVMQAVLSRAGVKDEAIDRLLQELHAQHWASPPGPGCSLQLQANGAEVVVVVSEQGREWRTACPIPD
jgi:hypothetical protein